MTADAEGQRYEI